VSWFRRSRRFSPGAYPKRGLKLHLGCGTVHLDGWVNIDLATRAREVDPPPDLELDVRDGLPFADGSARLIYHEHLMEHLTIGEGQRCLTDWFRLLEPGGVLRVATPDLEYLVERYREGWRDQAWLAQPEYAFIETRAEMMNVAFRWWDHRYLYDGEELARRLREAGFDPVRRCAFRESTLAELAGLETRADSKLVVEGVKP
jgi:predicted SAM-dependent methyltransferase